MVAELVVRAAELGIGDYGLTDHCDQPHEQRTIRAARLEFLAANGGPRFHFGAEASCVLQGELGGPLALDLSAEEVAELEIEYVIGSVHSPLCAEMEREAVIRDNFRQLMFLAMHPLVDIIGHPWWWIRGWQDADGRFTGKPWFDDFHVVPQSMHEEFAAAAVAQGTAVEVNAATMVMNPAYPPEFNRAYLEYLARLKERGVRLSIGSDWHGAQYGNDFEKAEAALATVGIVDGDFWRLPPRE
jgi:histidinol phosphatase-like PHP family hydrolase